MQVIKIGTRNIQDTARNKSQLNLITEEKLLKKRQKAYEQALSNYGREYGDYSKNLEEWRANYADQTLTPEQAEQEYINALMGVKSTINEYEETLRRKRNIKGSFAENIAALESEREQLIGAKEIYGAEREVGQSIDLTNKEIEDYSTALENWRTNYADQTQTPEEQEREFQQAYFKTESAINKYKEIAQRRKVNPELFNESINSLGNIQTELSTAKEIYGAERKVGQSLDVFNKEIEEYNTALENWRTNYNQEYQPEQEEQEFVSAFGTAKENLVNYQNILTNKGRTTDSTTDNILQIGNIKEELSTAKEIYGAERKVAKTSDVYNRELEEYQTELENWRQRYTDEYNPEQAESEFNIAESEITGALTGYKNILTSKGKSVSEDINTNIFNIGQTRESISKVKDIYGTERQLNLLSDKIYKEGTEYAESLKGWDLGSIEKEEQEYVSLLPTFTNILDIYSEKTNQKEYAESTKKQITEQTNIFGEEKGKIVNFANVLSNQNFKQGDFVERQINFNTFVESQSDLISGSFSNYQRYLNLSSDISDTKKYVEEFLNNPLYNVQKVPLYNVQKVEYQPGRYEKQYFGKGGGMYSKQVYVPEVQEHTVISINPEQFMTLYEKEKGKKAEIDYGFYTPRQLVLDKSGELDYETFSATSIISSRGDSSWKERKYGAYTSKLIDYEGGKLKSQEEFGFGLNYYGKDYEPGNTYKDKKYVKYQTGFTDFTTGSGWKAAAPYVQKEVNYFVKPIEKASKSINNQSVFITPSNLFAGKTNMFGTKLDSTNFSSVKSNKQYVNSPNIELNFFNNGKIKGQYLMPLKSNVKLKVNESVKYSNMFGRLL